MILFGWKITVEKIKEIQPDPKMELEIFYKNDHLIFPYASDERAGRSETWLHFFTPSGELHYVKLADVDRYVVRTLPCPE